MQCSRGHHLAVCYHAAKSPGEEKEAVKRKAEPAPSISRRARCKTKTDHGEHDAKSNPDQLGSSGWGLSSPSQDKTSSSPITTMPLDINQSVCPAGLSNVTSYNTTSPGNETMQGTTRECEIGLFGTWTSWYRRLRTSLKLSSPSSLR